MAHQVVSSHRTQDDVQWPWHFSSKTQGISSLGLSSETIGRHTPGQVIVSLRLTGTAFVQAGEAVKGGIVVRLE